MKHNETRESAAPANCVGSKFLKCSVMAIGPTRVGAHLSFTHGKVTRSRRVSSSAISSPRGAALCRIPVIHFYRAGGYEKKPVMKLLRKPDSCVKARED